MADLLCQTGEEVISRKETLCFLNADAGGLLADFEAHERIITDEGIIARPFRARIFI
ncbi:MAG: hypothetical protein V1822_04170 [Candidatus Micrarchaeota archaeon]